MQSTQNSSTYYAENFNQFKSPLETYLPEAVASLVEEYFEITTIATNLISCTPTTQNKFFKKINHSEQHLSLKDIGLDSMKQLTPFLRTFGPRIKIINLTKESFSTEIIHLISMNCLKLNSLSLDLYSKLTDKELFHLKDLPLKELSLSYCKQITDEGLSHLKDLPLKKLNLSHCKQITDEGLSHLKDLPLKSLNLTNCNLITDKGLDQMNANPPLSSMFKKILFWG